MKNIALLIPCLALATAANAATISFDFETSNQFSDNFRVARGTAGSNIGQTSTAGNDYMWGGMISGTQNVVAVYDTTPGNAADTLPSFAGPLTIDFKVATANAAQIVGLYILDSTNVNNSLSVRLNITATGSSERISFAKDGNLSTGSGAVAYSNTTGFSGTGGAFNTTTSYQVNSNIAHSPEATPVFYGLTATYTPGTNDDTTLTLTYGTSFSATVTVANADRIDNPTLGFFISNYTVNTTTKIDDIAITYSTIPEPSSYALLLGAFSAGLFVFQRKRRA